jgi:hypothetical protein
MGKLLEWIACLLTHGLFASKGRIRRMAVQSQAGMVGKVETLPPVVCQRCASWVHAVDGPSGSSHSMYEIKAKWKPPSGSIGMVMSISLS